jgi:hypothetical protein
VRKNTGVKILMLVFLLPVTGILDSCSNYGDISLDDLLLKRATHDNFEPDNSPAQAKPITLGPGGRQEHSIYPEGDVDWISFSAHSDSFYVVETFSVNGHGSVGPYDADTYISVYAPNGTTVLIEDDDGGTGKGFSKLSFKPSASGVYYIKVVDYNTAHGLSPAKTGEYAIRVNRSTGLPFNCDGLWHLSARLSHDADGLSWYYGIEGVGTYDTGVRNYGYLTTDQVAVCAGTPVLRFWEWCMDEPGSTYEERWVQVSVDGGTTWDNVYQSVDDLGVWIETVVDLSPYEGLDVLIRFSFDTLDDLANNYEGWYIDEVRIE